MIASFIRRALLLLALSTSVYAQLDIYPTDRISAVDDSRRVPVPGADPRVSVLFDRGPVPASLTMEHIVLAFRADAAQNAALDAFASSQQSLTPESFGAHFGISDNDLAAVSNWLRSYGFAVDPPPRGRQWLLFSGTAGQVEAAFHTQIHEYFVNGRRHYANASTPDIPQAFAEVVAGPVSLDDFDAASHPVPHFEISGSYYIAPSDFAAIYDTQPLYMNGSNLEGGEGVNIAIVARSNVSASDVSALQSHTSFPFKLPQVVTPYGNPGIDCNQSNPNYAQGGCIDWFEATLDVTRAGSVAPQAQTILVPVASTNTTDGIQLSAQYIVDHNLAQIVSMSFSDCEPAMSFSAYTLWGNLWSQAAAEGMSVVVASGDWGADDCYPQRQAGATTFEGQAVNGLCSPPNAVCVGGTMFNDTPASSYWSNGGNALGYIPENVWNEMPASINYASGGGASALYSKPAWQQAITPADGWRDVPDVAFSAAFHDAYVIYMAGQQLTTEGTSASAPSFAGILALMLAATGSDAAWGNAAPTLYGLQQANPSSNLFHPTVAGNNNNSVNGVTGFSANGGTYNQATGLGSVDAAVLASVWPSTTIGLSVTNSANFSQGETGAIYTVTVSTAARPSNGVVTLTDNLPTGLAMSSMAGTGWTCSTTSSSGSCTSNAALSTNTTYLITVTVNVAANSPFSVTNTVSLTGGGSLGASAQDVTTVTLPAQTITFGSLPPKLIGPPAFTVSATASSGLQVSFMSLRRSVCTVSGSTVMLVALGTCTIQASQGGDSDYAPAPNVDQSFLVVSLCDFTQAGSVGAADVQSVINAALGTATPSYDLNGDGMVNVLDVQIEIEAAIGRGCFATN